jgi:shikimate dehydrogenase
MATEMTRKILIGLVGSGIQRSLSPALHEQEAGFHGLRLHYQIIDLDRTGSTAADLPKLLSAARTMGFAGLNITYPGKQAVIPLLEELSDEARVMGAVNTVVFADGRLIGHNTDGSGWVAGFRRALPKADLSRVVLLGAGGAGSAIAHAVLRMGAEQLLVVDVDLKRSVALAGELAQRYGVNRASSNADIAQALTGATGLIHASPTGMDKQPGMPLPAALLKPNMWVSEIVYFPLETALLRHARQIGCATVDGGGMAVGQAVGAFELFTGLTPDALRMLAHFRNLVSTRTSQ